MEAKLTESLCLSLVMVVIGVFRPAAVMGQSVEGSWTTYNEQTGSALSVIEIKRAGNSIEGTVSRVILEPYQGEDPICTKCPGERKDKKVIGMNFLWGFTSDGDS